MGKSLFKTIVLMTDCSVYFYNIGEMHPHILLLTTNKRA